TAIALMRERGLDLDGHRGRQLDERLLRGSDLVLVMERGHQKWIEAQWPHAKGRVFRWGHWSDFDVPDPYRRGEKEFRETLVVIDKGLEDWKARLRVGATLSLRPQRRRFSAVAPFPANCSTRGGMTSARHRGPTF